MVSVKGAITQVTMVGNQDSVPLGTSGRQHRTHPSEPSTQGVRGLGYLSPSFYSTLRRLPRAGH